MCNGGFELLGFVLVGPSLASLKVRLEGQACSPRDWDGGRGISGRRA